MYVDDLIIRGNTPNEVKQIKSDSVPLFKKRGFKLHKWMSSDVSEIEHSNSNQNQELSYVKPVLNRDSNESKFLGLG